MRINASWIIPACLILAGACAALLSNPAMMLADGDTAWHFMAGEWIRAHGIPKTDPWSFTANGAPWVNLAWLWDVWMSKLTGWLGWYGQLCFLAVLAGATLVTLYLACLHRSQNVVASLFTVLLVFVSMRMLLRPLWASNFFIAALFLLAIMVRDRRISIYWWYVLPPLVALWVNLHGGFIVAFPIAFAFFAHAVLAREKARALHIAMAGALSLLAVGASPYGYVGVAHAVIGTFTTPAAAIIREFQPTRWTLAFLFSYLYVPVLIIAIISKRPKLPLAETLLAYGFIPLALLSERYWTFVFLFSAPLLAMIFSSGKKARATKPGMAIERIFSTKTASAAAIVVTACAAVWLFTPMAARAFRLEGFDPYSYVKPGVNFIAQHYPHTRFLNDYDLGGPLIAASGGTLPVFIDGRGETAYPREVVADFTHLATGDAGWETMIGKYEIGGIIVSAFQTESILAARFKDKGWKKAYGDETIAIYIKP